MSETQPEQLRMLWPKALLNTPPTPVLPAGYVMRFYDPQRDLPAYLDLMHGAGFAFFNEKLVDEVLSSVLADGFFLAVHIASQQFAATAIANHAPHDWCPAGGELGWVAGDADHAGKRLGRAVCAAAVARLLAAGYSCIYLLTEDYRLPALRTYLGLGFEPFLCGPDMKGRWKAVCENVNWPFTPDRWPTSA